MNQQEYVDNFMLRRDHDDESQPQLFGDGTTAVNFIEVIERTLVTEVDTRSDWERQWDGLGMDRVHYYTGNFPPTEEELVRWVASRPRPSKFDTPAEEARAMLGSLESV